MKIHVFKGDDEQWRWNLRARGRVFATSGESFDSRANAKRAATRMRDMIRDGADLEIVIEP